MYCLLGMGIMGIMAIAPGIEELMEIPVLLEGRAHLCLSIFWAFCGILECFIFLDFPLYTEAWQANEKHEGRENNSVTDLGFQLFRFPKKVQEGKIIPLFSRLKAGAA